MGEGGDRLNLGLESRVAIVTGGAQGIGAEIVRTLTREGATVYYTSRSQDAIDRMTCGHGILVRDYSTQNWQLAVPYKPHILINNAGSTLGMQDPHGNYAPVMGLNFDLAVQTCNRYIPFMKELGWGRVVNISSCSGLEQRGPVSFSCAKAALTAYTRSMGLLLAKEAPGVVMTAVFPGVVFTAGGHWDKVLAERPEHAERYLREQVPIGRFGKPEEIAPLVAFLCSEHASFMHGALVPADGGLSKHFWNQVAA